MTNSKLSYYYTVLNQRTLKSNLKNVLFKITPVKPGYLVSSFYPILELTELSRQGVVAFDQMAFVSVVPNDQNLLLLALHLAHALRFVARHAHALRFVALHAHAHHCQTLDQDMNVMGRRRRKRG